jgi:ribonucleoside-diphosphate reductase alpha chain
MENMEMNVVKRDGFVEHLQIEKIHKVTAWACEGLNVSQSELETEAHLMLFDGIKTSAIHDALIKSASTLITVDAPDYTFVAARLLLQKLYKEVNNSIEYPHLDQYLMKGVAEGRLNPILRRPMKFDIGLLNSAIDPTRDLLFTYLGLQTLADRYFIRTKQEANKEGKIIELPQHMWMRVAMGLALNEDNPTARAIEFYNVLSKLEFVSSTPTLFNSGTNHSQLSSCYLNTVDDSIDGIYGTIHECANLSKYAGGIGTDWTRVRPAGDPILGTNGQSAGVIPYLKVFNDTAVAVNQGGKRNGAFAAYLEPWHPDLYDFCELKKNSGDERRRAHDIFPALWMPDLFFKRVKEGGVWSFFSPREFPELHEIFGDEFENRYKELEHEGKAVKQLPAMDVWKKILTSLFETGHPWITFKDECNRRNPQDHVGVIHNSNLCVVPETLVLTDKGHLPISDLVDQSVNVWNGEEFSNVTVVKTGENQKVIKILLSDGAEIECTSYHKFYVQEKRWGNAVEKRASELKQSDKLIKFDLPVIEGDGEFPHAYTAGFFCGDGTYGRNAIPVIQLYGEKKKLVENLAIKSGSNVEQAQGRLSYVLVDDLPAKFTVPHNKSIKSRLTWFAGLLDADGTVARNGANESLQVGSIEFNFLNEVRLMLQTLGVTSKVTLMREAVTKKFADGQDAYDCQPLYRLLINSIETQRLVDLGLKTNRLQISKATPNRSAHHFVQVVSVLDEGRFSDTYCFSEPKRHMGVFNGILTGNCTEIALNNSDDETAVCNLGSINLARVNGVSLDRGSLHIVVETAVRMLDNVIDLNFYPSMKAKYSNLRHRPIGLGVMGYTECLVQRGIDFESDRHLKEADYLFEMISYYAINASCELAKERGVYPSYKGSKWDRGILPIDTAKNAANELPKDGFNVSDLWNDLRDRIKQYGMRNSNLMAIAPTATISNIAGTTPCIEPIYKRTYTKANLSGSFLVVDPTLKYGRPELCKEAFEVSPVWIVKAAAVRQKWIDQAQSVNIFVNANITGPQLAEIYMKAWELGLKTTYYLRSQAVEMHEKVCSITDKDCESCQ